MFEFDARQVTWIATANDAIFLDQPFCAADFGNFTSCRRRPSTAECLVLAGEVMRTAIDSVGITGFKPDVSLRRHLAHLSARQISQLTLEAVAHAVAAQRKELQKGNFPRWLFDPEATGESSTPPHYMH